MKKTFFFLAMLYNITTTAQTNPALADTLAKMVVIDQKAAGLPPDGLSLDSPQWHRFKDSVFTLHYTKLEKIFNRTGYPGYDQVGTGGSYDFWLLVQHLDKWPAFQQRVLDSMQKQMARNNASPKDFAYLTDRVRLNSGQKQLYGTQVGYNTDSCQAVPKPLENPESVNKRRKAVGLERIERYLNQMSESHFQMNRAVYEKKGILSPKLYAEKE